MFTKNSAPCFRSYRHIKISAFLAVGVMLVLPAKGVRASDLVTNGGFETADFTGWTLTWNPTTANFGLMPWFAPYFEVPSHTGVWSAYFAGLGPDYDTFSQTLTTIPGATYTLDYWLQHFAVSPLGGNNSPFPTVDGFEFLVDATTELSIQSQPDFGYTEYSDTFVGTGSDTITFGGNSTFGLYSVDDVSVTLNGSVGASTPEPGPLSLLLGIGVAGVRYARRRRASRA